MTKTTADNSIYSHIIAYNGIIAYNKYNSIQQQWEWWCVMVARQWLSRCVQQSHREMSAGDWVQLLSMDPSLSRAWGHLQAVENTFFVHCGPKPDPQCSFVSWSLSVLDKRGWIVSEYPDLTPTKSVCETHPWNDLKRQVHGCYCKSLGSDLVVFLAHQSATI